MRSISSEGLAKIAQTKGTEPIFIIEVDWAGNGHPLSYADRDVEGIPGRILQVSELDNVVDVTKSNSSQEISVTLSDIDGTIKSIMDQHDIHQRSVAVYQYFHGLALSDKFLLFDGKVSTPIEWNEGDRTVSFSIISQLEDQEIGFSAEQGQFPFIPKDIVGRAWPIIFGKCFDVPALQIVKAIQGKTLCGVGLIGGADLHKKVPLGGNLASLGVSISTMNESANLALAGSTAWADVDGRQSRKYLEQYNGLVAQMVDTINNYFTQQSCARQQRDAKVADQGPSCNPIHILGGEDFPQDTTIVLNINGALFTGVMHNDEFTVSSSKVPTFMETAAQLAADKINREQCAQPQPPTNFDMSIEVPCGRGDVAIPGFSDSCHIRRTGFIVGGADTTSQPNGQQVAQDFWAEPGSTVNLQSDQPITYIVSITPGTVLTVKAYKQVTSGNDNKPTGETKLVDVPKSYYSVSTKNYGSITAVQIVTPRALSTILDQYGQSEGWSDELYVTFESSIGPNMVDIMKYIIANWTNGNGATANLQWDDASFDYVREIMEQFPMNFAVLDQRNTITLLKDMAYQGTCAVWLSNGKFYLKYLAEEPDADDTITVSDTEHQKTVVELTSTEDIVTKWNIKWRLSYANGNGEEPETMILRHNVALYGTKQQDYDFYCYNQPDIIIKKATFWLIRRANTWKRIRFTTPLTKLNLETFDTVSLDLPPYVANGPIKAVVEKASYDSESQSVNFECLVPVKSGTMAKYKFFWPHSLTHTDVFPTPEETASGAAGGGGSIVGGVTGELPVGYTGVIGVPGQPIIWKDSYSDSTQYVVNDAVLYNGASWLCISTTIGHRPPDKNYWKKITASQQQGGTIFVGGPNIVYFGGSDRGDSTPGSIGFRAQPLIANSVYAAVNNQPRPVRDLSLNFVTGVPLPEIPSFQAQGITIDIQTTKIIDSKNPGVTAKLSSLIQRIIGGAIYLRSGSKGTNESGDGEIGGGGIEAPMWGVTDGVNHAVFDFAYDKDGKKWGAGTAFLKDDDTEE